MSVVSFPIGLIGPSSFDAEFIQSLHLQPAVANSDNFSGSTAIGLRFRANATGDVTHAIFKNQEIGGGSAITGLYAQIWSDSSNSPSAQIGGNSATSGVISGANLGLVTELAFNGVVPVVVKDSDYWVVFNRGGYTSGDNFTVHMVADQSTPWGSFRTSIANVSSATIGTGMASTKEWGFGVKIFGSA